MKCNSRQNDIITEKCPATTYFLYLSLFALVGIALCTNGNVSSNLGDIHLNTKHADTNAGKQKTCFTTTQRKQMRAKITEENDFHQSTIKIKFHW